MIVGNSSVLAIESNITHAYARLSYRALGFFVIHVAGREYGVRSSDATMLARSFDEAQTRINNRGSHTAPFAISAAAGQIADAFREVCYSETPQKSYFGIEAAHFSDIIYKKNIMWAPDGDEAFDDGSYVLQFDVDDRVRLIAFKCGESGLHDPTTLRDVWIKSDEFYSVLQGWFNAFESEWMATPKTPELNSV